MVERRSAITRAMMSLAPPAANGTTSRTFLVGRQAGVCACADCPPSSGRHIAAPAEVSIVRRLGRKIAVMMHVLPGFLKRLAHFVGRARLRRKVGRSANAQHWTRQGKDCM